MAKNNKVISDLTKGMKVEEIQVAVRSGGLMKYANKSGNYLNLMASDHSGDVKIIMWDDKDPEQVWKQIEGHPVVEVDGKVDEYNGQIQIIATDIFPAKNYDINMFIPKSDKDLDKMYDYLVKTAKTISHSGYRALVMHFLKDPLIFKAVGAKAIHHARAGGWLEHTYEVTTVVNSTCKLFDVDKSLIRAGTILHDIGKLWTYDIGVTIERNQNDFLIGHINMGVRAIIKAVETEKNIKINESDLNKLLHLILNHHDMEPEHDRVAYTLESIILRKADNISSLADRFQNMKSEHTERDAHYDNVTKMQYYFNREE